MIFLIFSDLHSNLEALKAFQNHIASIKHDVKVCLGDTVGYGADPNPCMDLLHKEVGHILETSEEHALTTFHKIERVAYQIANRPVPSFTTSTTVLPPPPRLTEDWFC